MLRRFTTERGDDADFATILGYDSAQHTGARMRRLTHMLTLATCIAIATPACGRVQLVGAAPGDSGVAVDGGGPAAPLAVQKCNLVTSTACTQTAQCFPGASEANCESQLELEFDCSLAAGDFSSCMQDVQSAGCDSLLPDAGLTMPQSCLPPITTTPISDAQSKCYALVDALCTQSIQCMEFGGNMPLLVQNCEDDVTTDIEDGLPCLLATAVGPGYAPCLAAIPNLPCAVTGDAAGGGPGSAGMSTGTDTSTGMVTSTGTGMGLLEAISACPTALVFSP
ncbi:MAG: hypothetical protein WBY94_21315 [Polyangiaceae bacterium]